MGEESQAQGSPRRSVRPVAAETVHPARIPCIHTLKAKGASLRATEQPIDTSTAAGKCFLDMLGVFAEFETNLRRERQLEGIQKAKAEGIYKGRKPSIDVARVRDLRASGMGPAAIAKELKMARSSVYRVLGER